MRVVPVSGVRTVETHWVPMADGRRLAARLFIPADAEARPVPLILEYIPYRRRDGTRIGDDQMHLWFAANGFACARVDISGSGDSDGTIEDEYVEREQDDVLEIIEHLCTQPWCSGSAGMIGISWGGFSGLQAAFRRPPRLKAVVTMCSTDDRYNCDVHYSGGCLLNDNFGWGGAFFVYGAMPPDPEVVGEERWRDLWRQRIDAHPLAAAGWLSHQSRDAFWKHGSVCEDWSRIDCAVMAVGGWLDGYTPTVFRLVENMQAPTKGLCGPWGHKEPQVGVPGPAIGFLQDCKRFFGRWLKDEANGAEGDPAMRLFLMDPFAPATHHDEIPGRWLGFPRWPSPAIIEQRLLLGPGTLADTRPAEGLEPRKILSPLTVGVRAHEWCPYGTGRVAPESAPDQREDDAGSLVFDSAPLGEALAITGVARVTLRIAADKPQAMVAARLTSVAPDGASGLVTFAVLNLSRRGSQEHPSVMTPGQFETVELLLKPVGQVVPAGNRLRLAISSSYWPMTWPSPEAATLTVDPAGSHVDLPVLSDESALVPVDFAEAEFAQPGPVTVKTPAKRLRSFSTDYTDEKTTFQAVGDDGRFVLDEIGTEVTSWWSREFSVTRGDPLSCVTRLSSHEGRSRGDWKTKVDTEFTVTCDARSFFIRGWVKAYDGDTLFGERQYDQTIPRDFM